MRYTLFGIHTGLRVSELVLGTGNFGTRWGHGAQPGEARRILDAYADAGGNFIDTADSYQAGQSEEILGKLLAGRRDRFVLATKYSMRMDPDAGILVNGNSRKAMVSSVEQSLKRLRTDRIDLLWVHMADGVTPAEEIVRGFDDLPGPARSCTRACRTSRPGAWRARRRSPNCAGPRRSPVCRSSTAWSRGRANTNCCRPARRWAWASSPGRRWVAAC